MGEDNLSFNLLPPSAILPNCHPDVIPDLHLYPCDPWDLNVKAMGGEGKKWYFYSRKTQTRITGSGYWQPIGFEEPIYSNNNNNNCQKIIGMKKYSAFYIGKPFEGVKTNWIMHEYYSVSCSSSTSRSTSSRKSNSKFDYSRWVVICRVYENNGDVDNDGTELSCLDEIYLSLDDLDEISFPN
ncbi:hypothetical protein MIMGU_mgv1a024889mg [Erythranthe guttata]|uniref:NAC domain-containing protein n=1 Tax=Erythranthe guttata TaxID=4155 RepID=A0A022R961_ERYGU|nr:hypothetical protein MIMGU_mgv1a024889mg [Erythranthe guttata]